MAFRNRPRKKAFAGRKVFRPEKDFNFCFPFNCPALTQAGTAMRIEEHTRRNLKTIFGY